MVVTLGMATAGNAVAQMAGPQQHVDLSASIEHGPDLSAFDTSAQGVAIPITPRPYSEKLFDVTPPEEGGWKGLAGLLEALTPNIDTSVPLTSSQITNRISEMLDHGQNQQALNVIDRRQAQLEEQGSISTDVQLLFLRGRALASLGRHNEAIATFLHMTTQYPELPEPWNNLASEYVKQGKLDMALDALNMALKAAPNYATAQANLGEVQLMLAQRSFTNAARMGARSAATRASETSAVLKH
ncbi:tetratricopeptide repeat protein [Allopusillimonas ginsengisoli]|nr:tetratricopeptide repeat protein [Allopusillimonas ginsengisoli]